MDIYDWRSLQATSPHCVAFDGDKNGNQCKPRAPTISTRNTARAPDASHIEARLSPADQSREQWRPNASQSQCFEGLPRNLGKHWEKKLIGTQFATTLFILVHPCHIPCPTPFSPAKRFSKAVAKRRRRRPLQDDDKPSNKAQIPVSIWRLTASSWRCCNADRLHAHVTLW